MIGWLLAKGRDDADARIAATILATQLASNPDAEGSGLIKPLLREMLSKAAVVAPRSSSRLFDLNGEVRTAMMKQISANILR